MAKVSGNSSTIDPITAEVLSNALQSIAEEMGAALVRSAYSTNIKERRDCSCALFDAHGNLIVLAEHIPIHLGSMQGLMSAIARDKKKWKFKPGDVVIANDPYLGGGSHLPDVTLVKPIFYQKSLVAFASNIAHWSDIGGISPGVGTAGACTEIYQEGIRIPPTRIISEGKVRQDILDLLILNMRNREERVGDLNAQIASIQLGERRIHELLRRYNKSTIRACFSELYRYSETCLRQALQTIPAGSYVFRDEMDDDGVTDKPLPICVKLTIHHGKKPHILFDFCGSAPQASGGINMVWSALLATVLYATKAIVCPHVSPNAGFLRPIEIYTPPRSLLNAEEPAAVGGRTDTCQRVVDTIMGALSYAIPDRIIAASNGATTAIIFGGTKGMSEQEFVYVEALGGGMGARAQKDGMDGIQVHITNTSNLPIEAMELEYPLRVLRYELIPDSGGAGTFRGGLGIRKEFETLLPMLFLSHSDRHRIAPWGLHDGKDGTCGRFVLSPGTPHEKILPSKTSGIELNKGDIVSVRTAGGGGYGSPLFRTPEKVAVDLIQGKITKLTAEKEYGVRLTKSKTVDLPATKQLRNSLRSTT